MKISQTKQALAAAIDSSVPVMLWGPPGIGKSAAVHQFAEAAQRKVIDWRLSQMDPVDLRGIPHVNGDGRSHWCPPSELPGEGDGPGLFFLDEMNAAPPLVQAAAYQLVLDRKLGEYTLPDDWAIVAAGNRETDRAVTSRMSSALANRFIHLGVDVDLDEWMQWALREGLPTELIAFIKFKPNLLHSFDPDQKAFPTPRSWEFVARLIGGQSLPKEIELSMITGAVGEGPAGELSAFLRTFRSLPDIDGILLAPDKAQVPEEPSALYAVSAALAQRASEQNLSGVTQYLGRIPTEFGALTMSMAYERDSGIANARAWSEWCTDNKTIFGLS